MLIKDPEKIERISERNEEKNRKFRSYLKIKDDKEIDRVVKPIFNRIREQIDCLECGNCCRKAVQGLSNGDLLKLEMEFGLARSELLEQYTVKDEFNELILKGPPCGFQDGNVCRIYSNRPKDCISFPHIHKPGFTPRLFGVLEFSKYCPIVFNVLEELKAELHFR